MSKVIAASSAAPEKTALIAVLKAPRDLEIAARDHWYRIPLKKAPKRYFTHIAFYQPACFKPDGKRIEYYARVAGRAIRRREDLFPGEPASPPASRLYLRYGLGPLRRLPAAVLNTSGTRVVFGYAPLKRLAAAGTLLGLFNSFPLENMMRRALEAAGLAFAREHVVLRGAKVKYRLDLAVFCKRGKLDIECDGRGWHSAPAQRARDAVRDNWLRRRGWILLRFGEHEILCNLPGCVREIKKAVRTLGGIKERP